MIFIDESIDIYILIYIERSKFIFQFFSTLGSSPGNETNTFLTSIDRLLPPRQIQQQAGSATTMGHSGNGRRIVANIQVCSSIV